MRAILRLLLAFGLALPLAADELVDGLKADDDGGALMGFSVGTPGFINLHLGYRLGDHSLRAGAGAFGGNGGFYGAEAAYFWCYKTDPFRASLGLQADYQGVSGAVTSTLIHRGVHLAWEARTPSMFLSFGLGPALKQGPFDDRKPAPEPVLVLGTMAQVGMLWDLF